jgi:hypothetical protein
LYKRSCEERAIIAYTLLATGYFTFFYRFHLESVAII